MSKLGNVCKHNKNTIVHLRRGPTVPKTEYAFSCGGERSSVVDQYKYLGLIFTGSVDYSEMAKCIVYGGMPFQCFRKLYDLPVQPISYGAAIWGHTQYRCIDQVQY